MPVTDSPLREGVFVQDAAALCRELYGLDQHKSRRFCAAPGGRRRNSAAGAEHRIDRSPSV